MVKMQMECLDKRTGILETSVFQAYGMTSGHSSEIVQDRTP